MQAAALKPADFFGNDDVLYLMEDMATGEIRLSILWEWLHKAATLTESDDATGVQAGDLFTAGALQTAARRGVREAAARGQPRRARRLEDDDAAGGAGDRRDLRARPGEAALVHRPAEHHARRARPRRSAAAASRCCARRSPRAASGSRRIWTSTSRPQRVVATPVRATRVGIIAARPDANSRSRSSPSTGFTRWCANPDGATPFHVLDLTVSGHRDRAWVRPDRSSRGCAWRARSRPSPATDVEHRNIRRKVAGGSRAPAGPSLAVTTS